MMHFPLFEIFLVFPNKISDSVEKFHILTFFPKNFRFSPAKISDDLFSFLVIDRKFWISPLFLLFQFISPRFWKNFPLLLQIFPLISSNLRVFTCFVFFVSPYFDYDAFMHHTMQFWTPRQSPMMSYLRLCASSNALTATASASVYVINLKFHRPIHSPMLSRMLYEFSCCNVVHWGDKSGSCKFSPSSSSFKLNDRDFCIVPKSKNQLIQGRLVKNIINRTGKGEIGSRPRPKRVRQAGKQSES